MRSDVPRARERWLTGNRLGSNIFHRDFRLSSFDDDGEELSTELALEPCGNTKSYVGGMKICPGADPRDGLLDATMVASASRTKLIRLFTTVFNCTHVDL